MIIDSTYYAANQFPSYYDPYMEHPQLHPQEPFYLPMDYQKSRERFKHPNQRVMRRSSTSETGAQAYYDMHYYNELNPYYAYEENAEESEDDSHSYNHYDNVTFHYNDQYPDIARLASRVHSKRKDRKAHQSTRLHYKSKDDEVAWPQSAVYVNQPMILVDPVLEQHHYRQTQQQILGACATDHVPSRLLSPPQPMTTASTPLSKPSNNGLSLSGLPTMPFLQHYPPQNQPYFFNIANNQSTSLQPLIQPFFNANTSPLSLMQQPNFHQFSLPQAFFPSTDVLNGLSAPLIEKTDNTPGSSLGNEQKPIETSPVVQTSAPSSVEPSAITSSTPLVSTRERTALPKRRRSMMENILSSFHLLQPDQSSSSTSSNHTIYKNQNDNRSWEQLPTANTSTSNPRIDGSSADSHDKSNVNKLDAVSPMSAPSATSSSSAVENDALHDDTGATTSLSRLSRRTSLKLFRKASALRKRQYLWCYKPQQQHKQHEQEHSGATTTTDVPPSSSWIAFDVKNQLKLDKQYALISSRMNFNVNAQEKEDDLKKVSEVTQQQTNNPDDILTLYKQSQVNGPMLVSLQRGLAWSFDGKNGVHDPSGNSHLYEIACIPCQQSKFVVSDQLLNEERQKKMTTLKRSKSLDGLATRLLTTVLKQ